MLLHEQVEAVFSVVCAATGLEWREIKQALRSVPDAEAEERRRAKTLLFGTVRGLHFGCAMRSAAEVLCVSLRTIEIYWSAFDELIAEDDKFAHLYARVASDLFTEHGVKVRKYRGTFV